MRPSMRAASRSGGRGGDGEGTPGLLPPAPGAGDAGAYDFTAAQAAARVEGVARVLHADAPGLDHALAETLAAQAANAVPS